MLKVTAVWSGFSGAPGYSNFFFDVVSEGQAPAQSAVDRVAAFFAAIAGRIPPSVSILVNTAVGRVDAETGMLTDEYSANMQLPIPGTNPSATFPAPAGAVVNWKTGTIINGRRLRGRTFIVPLSTDCFQNDGTLTTVTINTIQAASNTLMETDNATLEHLVVWSRPRVVVDPVTQVETAVPGSTGDVTGSVVPDKTCILTSRRG